MIRSMTGFGRSQLDDADMVQTWEVRSVNSRFLDLKWKLPPQARNMEARFEKVVRRFASRGRVEISLNLQRQTAVRASFDAEQANAMLDAIKAFASSRGDIFNVNYMALMNQSALWTSAQDEDDEALFNALCEGLDSLGCAVSRKGIYLERHLHLVKEICCFLHYRQIRCTAHYNTYYCFHILFWILLFVFSFITVFPLSRPCGRHKAGAQGRQSSP